MVARSFVFYSGVERGVGALFWTRGVRQKVHYLSSREGELHYIHYVTLHYIKQGTLPKWQLMGRGIEVIIAQCWLTTRQIYLHQGEAGLVSSFETEYWRRHTFRVVRGKSRQTDNLRDECLGDGNERRRLVTLIMQQVELYIKYILQFREICCLDKFILIMRTIVESCRWG